MNDFGTISIIEWCDNYILRARKELISKGHEESLNYLKLILFINFFHSFFLKWGNPLFLYPFFFTTRPMRGIKLLRESQ